MADAAVPNDVSDGGDTADLAVSDVQVDSVDADTSSTVANSNSNDVVDGSADAIDAYAIDTATSGTSAVDDNPELPVTDPTMADADVPNDASDADDVDELDLDSLVAIASPPTSGYEDSCDAENNEHGQSTAPLALNDTQVDNVDVGISSTIANSIAKDIVNDVAYATDGADVSGLDASKNDTEADNASKAVTAPPATAVGSAKRPDLTRLVVYSSDTPDKADFENMIKCLKVEYSFGQFDEDPAATDADQMIALLQRMVTQSPEGLGFKSIALACHGPPGRVGAQADFCWEISESLKVTDDKQLRDPAHPVRRVIDCFANSVVDGGRVDLFACSLLGHAEGREVFQMIEKVTKTNFAASNNKTGNPKNPDSDWIMESDNVDVRPLYFYSDVSAFDGTFAATDTSSEGGATVLASA